MPSAASDAKVWIYLVYHMYWTLTLMLLMVYPKVLFHPNFSIKVSSSLASSQPATVGFFAPQILVHLLTAVPSPRWQHYGSQTALSGQKLEAGPTLGLGGFAPDRDPASAPHFAAECFFLTQLAMHYCLLPAGAPCLLLLLALVALLLTVPRNAQAKRHRRK